MKKITSFFFLLILLSCEKNRTDEESYELIWGTWTQSFDLWSRSATRYIFTSPDILTVQFISNGGDSWGDPESMRFFISNDTLYRESSTGLIGKKFKVTKRKLEIEGRRPFKK